jgi:hypothetical protein
MTVPEGHLPILSPLQRIEQSLQDAGVEIEGLAERLLAASQADELNRRQLMSRTEAAFREGFLMGRRWPKFAPYATDIWRKSEFYARHFASKAADPDAEQRYARYNDLG